MTPQSERAKVARSGMRGGPGLCFNPLAPRTQGAPMPPKPISRLPALDEPPKDPLLAGIFAKIGVHAGKLLNIHRVSGHAPKLFSGTAVYTAALRNDTMLPASLRELVIL